MFIYTYIYLQSYFITLLYVIVRRNKSYFLFFILGGYSVVIVKLQPLGVQYLEKSVHANALKFCAHAVLNSVF